MPMRALLQLTLDFLDGFGAAPDLRPNRPAEPVDPAGSAIKSIADTSPQPAPLRPSPRTGTRAAAPFVHPQANRQAQLAGQRVAYAFARGRRRTIGFVVGAEGLTVRAPRWVAQRDVDAALAEKAGWIVRKLAEAGQRQQRLDAAQIEWRDGAQLPFLGQSLALRLDPGQRIAPPGGALLDAAAGDGRQLLLALPADASAHQIRAAAQAWLQRQARRIFIERLEHFAPRLGVRWQRLVLSNAATRWGSASADGAIRLHWRLVHMHLPVIDYVVAHELSHLRVMDHSPRFWQTVASVVPDYAALRQQLKDVALPRW